MSSTFTYILTATAVSGVVYAAFALGRHQRRLQFIEDYRLPPGLLAKLEAAHPHLTHSELIQVTRGLKQYFRAYLKSGRRYVAMPSQVADDLWHEFILYTRDYDRFCAKAFGRFLHHTPAIVLRKSQKQDNEGLRRVWWQACKEEGIDVKAPKALPLLFALDADLNIKGGYHYTPDCAALRKRGVAGSQCGGDFSSMTFDGGTAGLGDGDGGSGDGDGGGGCGGD